MSSFDPIEHICACEAQQRQLAAHAKLPDTVSFHEALADRYAGLLVQARQLAPK